MNINKEVIGNGEEVVLIHGWGCDLRHMRPIVNILAEHYRVTNIDLPGRGGSDWDTEINTIHDFADAILPHLPEQAIYLPWSFGGLVTMSIAARFPERVNRIIGIATVPKFIEDKNWPGVAKPGFQDGFSEIKKIGFEPFFKSYYDIEFSNINPKPEAYYELLKLLKNTKEQDLDILLKGVCICDEADLREEFESLHCPIDLILGEDDTSVVKESHSVVNQLNPNVNLHAIPGAQHMFFWTHPELFAKKLKHILHV